MRRVAASLALAVGALRLTLADDRLRRMTISWFAINCGKWTFLVTNLVIAYDAGGPVAVGVLGLARYLTPTLLAPFAGVPVARWPAERVLFAANAIRAVGVVMAVGVVATGAPIWALYLAVAVEAGAGAFTRPLQMALLPCIARTPAQLVAANVTASAAEGLGTFIGPAIGGILLATTGPIGADIAVLVIYLIGLVGDPRPARPDDRTPRRLRAGGGRPAVGRCARRRPCRRSAPRVRRLRPADPRPRPADRAGRRGGRGHPRHGRSGRRGAERRDGARRVRGRDARGDADRPDPPRAVVRRRHGRVGCPDRRHRAAHDAGRGHAGDGGHRHQQRAHRCRGLHARPTNVAQ